MNVCVHCDYQTGAKNILETREESASASRLLPTHQAIMLALAGYLQLSVFNKQMQLVIINLADYHGVSHIVQRKQKNKK